MATADPPDLLVSIAYWSTAESIRRRSLMMRLAWERLRARRNPGTAIAASNAIIATTIMISTRVKPPRRLLSVFNMLFAFYLSLVCLFDCDPRFPPRIWTLSKAVLVPGGDILTISGMPLGFATRGLADKGHPRIQRYVPDKLVCRQLWG